MNAAQAHQILEVAPGCSERELTRQFRLLAQQAHPDAGGSSERFHELSQAYTVVLDDERHRGSHGVITTHSTSVKGRLQRLRRLVRGRFHHPTIHERRAPFPGGSQ